MRSKGSKPSGTSAPRPTRISSRCNHPINFNPGIIKGGDWASSVPAWCDVDCRLAVLPGWSVAACQEEIVACISAAARQHAFLDKNKPVVEWSGFQCEGYELAGADEPEAALRRSYGAVYGGELAGRRPHGDDRYALLRPERWHAEPVLRRRGGTLAWFQRMRRAPLAAQGDGYDGVVRGRLVRF